MAVRSTKGGKGKAGGLFGVGYKVPDTLWDAPRQGLYLGVPFKFPAPDVIRQVWNPPYEPGWLSVHPPEKQPYIHWVTRLACYASLQGKALDYVNEVSHMIWSGEVDHWPAHVKERFNRIEGLDYDRAIRYIRKNVEEIDQCWLDNADGMAGRSWRRTADGLPERTILWWRPLRSVRLAVATERSDQAHGTARTNCYPASALAGWSVAKNGHANARLRLIICFNLAL
ncbi:MAG: hypothetical protein ABGY96_18485 [bacterium]